MWCFRSLPVVHALATLVRTTVIAAEVILDRNNHADSRNLATNGFQGVGFPIYGSAAFNETGRGEALFGENVALASASGTRLVVGATGHDYSTPFPDPMAINENGGAIFLYEFHASNGNWNSSNPKWFFAGDPGEELGEYLSISSDGARIAIRRRNQSPYPVEVYDIPSSIQVGRSLTCKGDENGNAVTISSDGLRLAMSCLSAKGHVEIFEFVTIFGDWIAIGRLDGVANDDFFGFNIAFSEDGNRLAVTSPNHEGNSGLLQVFDYDGTAWSQVGADIVGSDFGSQLGFSMDLSGDGSTIIVSSPNITGPDGMGSVGSGLVYSFNSRAVVWEPRGSILYGTSENDKFGRAVSISDNGMRIAISSWQYDGSRGHVLMFEYDLIALDWLLIGAVTGGSQGSRLGFGRYSVAMTGDGSRLAAGEAWARDINGDSTGRVLVLDYAVSSNAPTPSTPEPPSPATHSPSQFPTAPDTQYPSSSATVAPSADFAVSPSAVFMSEPNSTSIKPNPTAILSTSTPSIFPSEESSTGLGIFDWDLVRVGPVEIRFSEDTNNGEIIITYEIHHRDWTAKVFEIDCEVPVASSIIQVNGMSTPISSTHDTLVVSLDIDEGNLTGSPIFEIQDSETGLIALCTRVDLVDQNGQSVVFHEQKLSISLSLIKGFTDAALELERNVADEVHASGDVDYEVTACQCNEALQCNNETLVQDSVVFLCVQTAAANIEISGIRSLTLEQGDLARNAIEDGSTDEFSEVLLNPGGDGKKAVIQTLLLSSFFNGDNPAAVIASGTCTLAFVSDSGSETRRLRAPISFDRMLQSGGRSNFGVKLDIAASQPSSGSTPCLKVGMFVIIVGLCILVWIT